MYNLMPKATSALKNPGAASKCCHQFKYMGYNILMTFDWIIILDYLYFVWDIHIIIKYFKKSIPQAYILHFSSKNVQPQKKKTWNLEMSSSILIVATLEL